MTVSDPERSTTSLSRIIIYRPDLIDKFITFYVI